MDISNKAHTQKLWSNIGLMLAALGIIGGISAAIWHFYFPKNAPSIKEVTVIRAENGQVKVKPADPGGMVVPNMDKTIYDNFSTNNGRQVKVERVLPLPEEPIDRNDIAKSTEAKEQENPNHNSKYAKDITDIIDSSKVHKPSAEPKNKLVVSQNEPVVDNEVQNEPQEDKFVTTKTEEVALTDEKKEAPVQLAAPKIATKSASAKSPQPAVKEKKVLITSEVRKPKLAGYRVQIASVKTQKEASQEWAKIKNSYGNVVSKYDSIIEKKDLGAKGTFYRLQLGPIDSESDARLLCKKLTGIKGCFVLRPAN